MRYCAPRQALRRQVVVPGVTEAGCHFRRYKGRLPFQELPRQVAASGVYKEVICALSGESPIVPASVTPPFSAAVLLSVPLTIYDLAYGFGLGGISPLSA